MIPSLGRSIILLLLLFSISCSAQEGELYDISVNDISIRVELADSTEKRQQGLMFRKSLAPDRGMLFIFDTEQKMSFWMKNTTIPLSIAYISKSGIIREIHDLEPLSEKSVSSSVSVLYALEVNQGYFTEKGVKVGDRVHFHF